MILAEDICYWCETRITRPSENLPWVCDYESADCDFHPMSWDYKTLSATGQLGPHQTKGEVHQIIKQHAIHKILARDKTQGLRLVDRNVVQIGNRAQRTSRAAAKNMLPTSGTMRRRVYETIKAQRDMGRTDSELEATLNGKHQTISASRRSLVLDGWIIDSGKTRKNAQGNDCIVWIEKDEVFREVLFHV